jgi:hypothetical protein
MFRLGPALFLDGALGGSTYGPPRMRNQLNASAEVRATEYVLPINAFDSTIFSLRASSPEQTQRLRVLSWDDNRPQPGRRVGNQLRDRNSSLTYSESSTNLA